MIFLPPPALQAAAPPTSQAPAPAALKAQYAWGYVGADGEGKGTLNLSLDAESGAVVLELQGLSERLMLLQGDAAAGYRLQIPRRQVDTRAAELKDLPLPFLPQVGTPSDLLDLVARGLGPGVQVTRRDASGPVKLKYRGRDEEGKDVFVWLERRIWKPAESAARPAEADRR